MKNVPRSTNADVWDEFADEDEDELDLPELRARARGRELRLLVGIPLTLSLSSLESADFLLLAAPFPKEEV